MTMTTAQSTALTIAVAPSRADRWVPARAGLVSVWRYVEETFRFHQGRLLLSLEGVEDRDAAEGLRGAWLSIPVASARSLEPGEFWPHQLVGLAVVDRQGRERGRVADVVPGAAHDLLSVELPGGARALVPAVAALVTVDLQAGRVLVDAVPGLLGEPEE